MPAPALFDFALWDTRIRIVERAAWSSAVYAGVQFTGNNSQGGTK